MIPLSEWLAALPEDPWKRPSRLGYMVALDCERPVECRVDGYLIPAKGQRTPRQRVAGVEFPLLAVMRKTAVVGDGGSRRLVRIEDVMVPRQPSLVFQHESGQKWLPAGARAKRSAES